MALVVSTRILRQHLSNPRGVLPHLRSWKRNDTGVTQLLEKRAGCGLESLIVLGRQLRTPIPQARGYGQVSPPCLKSRVGSRCSLIKVQHSVSERHAEEPTHRRTLLSRPLNQSSVPHPLVKLPSYVLPT